VKTARKELVNPKLFMNDVLARNGKLGRSACEIMAAAINAVDPYEIVKQTLGKTQTGLIIGNEEIPFNEIDRIFLIGFGKASVPMSEALLEILDGKIDFAEAITKNEKSQPTASCLDKLSVHLAGHPIPNLDSVQSTRSVLEKFQGLTSRDLVLVAISGGGSALFCDPVPGITLEDYRKLTDILLKSGADIHEINTLRKHLDMVKGGRLVHRLNPAKIRTLILSDVIGDRLDMIASGPTVPDPTTYTDAVDIIKKYDLSNMVPENIIQALDEGQRGEVGETLKKDGFQSLDVKNYLVGSNIKAAQAAREMADSLGYHSLIITTHLTGLTCYAAEMLGSILQTELDYGHPLERPACLIFGGETTVEISGDGEGGRNQDLVLRMIKKLADQPGVLFISLATDGEDGPTDAAGAVSDGAVYHDGVAKLGLGIDKYIETNNSYNYFQPLGGLIKIGSTGTNVNDLVLILIGCQE
jgi:glycerate 2-kinase